MVDILNTPLSIDGDLEIWSNFVKVHRKGFSHPRITVNRNCFQLKDLSPYVEIDINKQEMISASPFSREVKRRDSLSDKILSVTRIDRRSCGVKLRNGTLIAARYVKGRVELETVDLNDSLIAPLDEYFLVIDPRRKFISMLKSFSDIINASDPRYSTISCNKLIVKETNRYVYALCTANDKGTVFLVSNKVFGLMEFIDEAAQHCSASDFKVCTSFNSIAVRICNYIIVKSAQSSSAFVLRTPRKSEVLNVCGDALVLRRKNEVVIKSISRGTILRKFVLPPNVAEIFVSPNYDYVLALERNHLLYVPLNDPTTSLRISILDRVKSLAILNTGFIVCHSHGCTYYRVEHRGGAFAVERSSLPPSIRTCKEIAIDKAICLAKRSIVILEDRDCCTNLFPSRSGRHLIVTSDCLPIVMRMPHPMHSDTHLYRITSERSLSLFTAFLRELVNYAKLDRKIIPCRAEVRVRGSRICITFTGPQEEFNCTSLSDRSLDLANYFVLKGSTLCIDKESLSRDLNTLSLTLDRVMGISSSTSSIIEVDECLNVDEYDYLILSLRQEQTSPRLINVVVPTCLDVGEGISVAKSESFALIRRGCRDLLLTNDECFSLSHVHIVVDSSLNPLLEVYVENRCNIPILIIHRSGYTLVREGEKNLVRIRLSWLPRNAVSIIVSYPGGLRKFVFVVTVRELLELAFRIALKVVSMLGSASENS